MGHTKYLTTGYAESNEEKVLGKVRACRFQVVVGGEEIRLPWEDTDSAI